MPGDECPSHPILSPENINLIKKTRQINYFDRPGGTMFLSTSGGLGRVARVKALAFQTSLWRSSRQNTTCLPLPNPRATSHATESLLWWALHSPKGKRGMVREEWKPKYDKSSLKETHSFVRRKKFYQYSLLNQNVTAFTHAIQDLIGSISARLTGWLVSNSKRVDERLRVLFSNIDKQPVNKPANERTNRVNPSNQLRNNLEKVKWFSIKM